MNPLYTASMHLHPKSSWLLRVCIEDEVQNLDDKSHSKCRKVLGSYRKKKELDI